MRAEGSYPLQWPPGYPRARRRVQSRFGHCGHGVSFGEARDGLLDELRLLGAGDVVLSTNVELRRDGLPYANQRPVEDPGVSVFFSFKGDRRVICCDRYNRAGDNARAIQLTINAIRGMGRWGCSNILDAMFSGFQALPEHGSQAIAAWWDVLEVEPQATPEQFQAAYRAKAKDHAPRSTRRQQADLPGRAGGL